MDERSLTGAGPPLHPDFLSGGGEMGKLIRAFGWESTPLGSPARWPQALRTAVRLMLSTNHPVFIFWGTELTCFYNDAYSRSIGPEKHPAMLGAPGRSMWTEIWDIIGPQIEQVMSGEGPTWHEDALVPIIRHGKLDQVYWTYSYSPIDHADGVGGVLVLCNEVTERVLENQRKTQELDRLRDLFQRAPSFAAVLAGPEHRFEFANEAFQRIIGPRELIGKTVLESVPEVVEQGFVELLDRVYETGEPHIGRGTPVVLASVPNAPHQTKLVDFIFQAMRGPTGLITGVFVEGYDVTERLTAEARLRDTLTELQAIYDQSPVGMAQLDASLRYVRINEALAAMNGIPAADHIGRTVAEVVPDIAPKAEPALRMLLESGEPVVDVEIEGETTADPGVIHTWLESWYPMRDSVGAVTGINIVAQDITARRAAEKELRQREKHQHLLIGELNHRAKNTLALVQALAHQTLRGEDVPALVKETFNKRLAALGAAHSLLIQHNWTGAGLLDIAEQTLLAHCGDAARFTIDGAQVRVGAKPAVSIALALHELCTNATKYGALSNDEGVISLSWEVDDTPESGIKMRWVETGGPMVVPPVRKGFGSRLLETALASELHGTVTIDYRPEGVVCEIEGRVAHVPV